MRTSPEQLPQVDEGAGPRPFLWKMSVALTTALLGYCFFSVLAIVGALGIAATVGSGNLGFLSLVALILCVALPLLGVFPVMTRLPNGRGAHLFVLVFAAEGLLVASGLDTTILLFAGGLDSVGRGSAVLLVRTVILVAWVLSAAVWGSGCVLVERRSASKRPSLKYAVATGGVMGAIQVAAWALLTTSLA